MTTRGTSKHDLIDTATGKRYVKRTVKGRFKESDDVGRSLSADRRKTAMKKIKSGYGDQGIRSRRPRSGEWFYAEPKPSRTAFTA